MGWRLQTFTAEIHPLFAPLTFYNGSSYWLGSIVSSRVVQRWALGDPKIFAHPRVWEPSECSGGLQDHGGAILRTYQEIILYGLTMFMAKRRTLGETTADRHSAPIDRFSISPRQYLNEQCMMQVSTARVAARNVARTQQG